MVVVVCPECGGKVSTLAEACPHCGCPKQYIDKAIASQDYGSQKEDVDKSVDPIGIGDLVSFGKYGDEEIIWQVVDAEGNDIVMVAEEAIDCRPYNNEQCSIDWESCSLRTWLNEEFLRNAFDSSEQSMMRETILEKHNSAPIDSGGGEPIRDKVFCLSADEARAYFTDPEGRICNPSLSAASQGVWEHANGACVWWLRSPGHNEACAAVVVFEGSIDEDGLRVDCDGIAVRPAIRVELSPDNLRNSEGVLRSEGIDVVSDDSDRYGPRKSAASDCAHNNEQSVQKDFNDEHGMPITALDADILTWSDERKMEEAENNTSEHVLRHLSRDENACIRWRVPFNQACPEDVLCHLSNDDDADIRRGVGLNQNTPIDVLRKLAADENEEVRAGVARNSCTPKDVLRELSCDESWNVRWGCAKNASTPQDALSALAEDEDEDVRSETATNPNTPADALRDLEADDNFYVKKALKRRPQALKPLAQEANHPAPAQSIERTDAMEDVLNAYNGAVRTLTRATIILQKASLLAENAYRYPLANSYSLIAQQIEKAADWLLLKREYQASDFLFTRDHPEPLSKDFLQYRADLMSQEGELNVLTFEDLFQLTENITKDCFYDVMNAFSKAQSNPEAKQLGKILHTGSKAIWASASMMLLTDDLSRGCRNEELLFIPDKQTDTFWMFPDSYYLLFDYNAYKPGSEKTYLPDEFKLQHFKRADGHYEGERVFCKAETAFGDPPGEGKLVICSGDESNEFIYAQVKRWLNRFPFAWR